MTSRKIYITLISLVTLFTLTLPLITEVLVLLSSEGGKIYVIDYLFLQFSVTYEDLFIVQIIVLSVVVILTFFIQYYQVYRPFKKFNELRDETFKFTFGGPFNQLYEKISDIRLNVMKVKTYLNLFGYIYIKRTYPIFHLGFSQEQRDRYIKFWIIKFFWFEYSQGISGSSILREETLLGDLRQQKDNNYHLSRKKLQITRDIRLVFSFPIIKWIDEKYKIVGVVNIDTQNEEFATFLLSDEGRDQLETILKHFKYLSYFISDWM